LAPIQIGGARAARAQHAVLDAVVLAREGDLLALEQRQDDLERLVEAAGEVVERVAEGVVLGLVPAGAEAEQQAPAAHVVEGVGDLGEQGRVAEAVAGDEWPDGGGGGGLGDGAEQREGLPDAARLALVHDDRAGVAEDQVVRNPERVDADALGRLRHVAQLAPADRAVRPVPHLALAQQHAELEPVRRRIRRVRHRVRPPHRPTAHGRAAGASEV